MKSHDTISYFHYEQKPTCHFEHYDFSKNKRKHNFFQIVFYDQGHMHLESIKCSFIFQHEKLKGALL